MCSSRHRSWKAASAARRRSSNRLPACGREHGGAPLTTEGACFHAADMPAPPQLRPASARATRTACVPGAHSSSIVVGNSYRSFCSFTSWPLRCGAVHRLGRSRMMGGRRTHPLSTAAHRINRPANHSQVAAGDLELPQLAARLQPKRLAKVAGRGHARLRRGAELECKSGGAAGRRRGGRRPAQTAPPVPDAPPAHLPRAPDTAARETQFSAAEPGPRQPCALPALTRRAVCCPQHMQPGVVELVEVGR